LCLVITNSTKWRCFSTIICKSDDAESSNLP